MKNRITVYDKEKNAIIVFRLAKTSNKKISDGKKDILQTYSFSFGQLLYVRTKVALNQKIEPKEFFNKADSVCFDCPFKGYLKCYTHKYMQFSGFVSMLKSISKEFETVESIPTIEQVYDQILDLSKDRYIRFGTYGEPTLIPFNLVEDMVNLSYSHTGYTHQYMRKPEYHKYFMASTHNLGQAELAQKLGFRSFLAVKEQLPKDTAVICPASKEANFKSTCEKCGLCSGLRKGKKHIQILEH